MLGGLHYCGLLENNMCKFETSLILLALVSGSQREAGKLCLKLCSVGICLTIIRVASRLP